MFENDFDAVITIDVDLQDDPSAIVAMVEKFIAGADIVYGVRRERQTDTRFKRFTASAFYQLMALLGTKIPPQAADFRLLSRHAVEELKKFPERNLFLRGVIPTLGFHSDFVRYDRAARPAGESKYPMRKMLAFAWNGITGFSVLPLRLISFCGFGVSLFSVILIIKSLINYMNGEVIVGWTSTFIATVFFSGVILFSLGIVGEYIGKILIEVKRRPHYIVAEKIEKPFIQENL